MGVKQSWIAIGLGYLAMVLTIMVKSRLLSAESFRRHGQGIYRSVSVRSLIHKGEFSTKDGSRAFVDSDGHGSIAIGKICPLIRPGDLSFDLGKGS